jgi:hypothetical protein
MEKTVESRNTIPACATYLTKVNTYSRWAFPAISTSDPQVVVIAGLLSFLLQVHILVLDGERFLLPIHPSGAWMKDNT